MADENKSGMGLKTIIILALLMIVIAGVTSYGLMTYLGATSDSEQAEGKTVDKDIGPTYNLGDFVVNLSGSSGFQYVQTSIVVEVSESKVVAELEKRSPQIRDAIISILSQVALEDIEEPGRKTIKNYIRAKLNSILVQGDITRVWFTQFVVQ